MTKINKDKIRQLIAKNKTLLAIENLRSSSYVNSDDELRREITLHLSKFRSYFGDKRRGVISTKELRITLNQLNDSLLEMLDEIPEKELELPPLPKISRPKEPFIGLRWFNRDEAPIFFGRKKDIQKLYNWLIAGERLILLYGQSGVGKSSLLHAGLFPRLEYRWEVNYCRRDLEKGLPQQLNEIISALSNNDCLIILDQLEEIYTNPSTKIVNEGIEIFKSIALALNEFKNLYIILGFRKEYLAEIKDQLILTPNFKPVEPNI